MDRLDTLFPGRVEPSSSDYPGGAFRDKSTDTSNDGTPITLAQQINNIWGALLAILAKAGLSPDDVTEKVSASQVANAIFSLQKLSNDALANDLNLGKFSQGELSVTAGGNTVNIDPFDITVGNSTTTVASRYSKFGVRFNGPGQPGTLFPYVKHAVFEISSALDSASQTDASTFIGTVGSGTDHSHKIGTSYTLASLFDLGIPDTTKIFGVIIHNNYTAVRGITPCCQVELDDTVGNKWAISRITHHYTGADLQLDTTEPVYATVFYDGDYL
jgi:hypothetical protein